LNTDGDAHDPLGLALSQAGYCVSIVKGILEAPGVIVRDQPAVIVISMMGGADEWSRLRRLTDAPMIAFLHHPTQEQVLEALDGGVDDCQTDAMGIPERVSRVRALMRRSPPSHDRLC